MGRLRPETRTGGREATTGVIRGRFGLSVGKPDTAPPSEWRWTALSEVARMESGHTPSRHVPGYWGGKIPWIGIRDATENHGRTLDRTKQTVSQAGIDNSSARVLPEGTVCLSRTASVGYVVVMGRPMATSQDFVNWVCSDAIDNRFLKYVLVSEHDSMLRFASGTTHQTIYYPEAKAFHVCLPPLPEQRAIANILSALDDNAELNRRMNETLESMARAIFKSWFVDFDPVRSKFAGYTPRGMDSETASLFPDSFQESTLGKLPKGFRVAHLDSVLTELETGSRPKGGVGGLAAGVPSIGAESIVGLAKFDFGKTKYVSDDFYSQMTRGKLKSHDVLLYKDGGKPGVYEPHVGMFGDGFPFEKACINEHVYRIRGREPLSQPYLYFWLTSDLAMDEMRQKGTGVAIPGLNSTAVRSLSILVPSDGILRRYQEICDPMVHSILNNSNKSRTLSNMRDALLPKLISGEIRVKDAEKLAGKYV